jgi:hypothetical protein
MPLTHNIAVSANKDALANAINKKARRRRNAEYAANGGLFLIRRTINIAAADVDTANDELDLLVFPDGVFLVRAAFKFSALDSNASKTLTMNVNINTPAGAVEKTILATSQTPRAGGYVEADATGEVLGYDVGGKILTTKVGTAAATAAAGTVTVFLLVALDAVAEW